MARAVAEKNPRKAIRRIARILKKHPKAVLLFGKAGVQIGSAIALVETKSKIKVIDGISVNVYGGKELKTKKTTIGIGVEKNLIDVNDLIKIGMGFYATERVDELMYLKRPDFSIGVSGTLRF